MNVPFDIGMQSSKFGMKVSQTKTGADQRLLWTMMSFEQYLKKIPAILVEIIQKNYVYLIETFYVTKY